MKISRAITKRHKVTQTRKVLALRVGYPNYFLTKCKCFQCDGELGETATLAFTSLGNEYLCNACVNNLEKKYSINLSTETLMTF